MVKILDLEWCGAVKGFWAMADRRVVEMHVQNVALAHFHIRVSCV